MKKHILILIIIIVLSFSIPVHALYRVTDFIGGCADCLDYIDGSRINAKTKPQYAIVGTTPEHATYPSQDFAYQWDSDAGCAESLPTYVIPDTNAAGGCWVLLTPGKAAIIVANSVNDTHIDWGTGSNQVSAVDVPIADAGTIITGTEVETALQENRGVINTNTTNIGTNTTAIGLNTTAVATSAGLSASLSDETGSGAAVFGTGATIGTPAITGGTINNTPIVGAAGEFTTLSAAGNFDVVGGTAGLEVLRIDGTEYYLINPYKATSYSHKGATHTHSTPNSGDAFDSPIELETAYLDIGYDFIILTDHDSLTADPSVAGILHINGEEVSTTGIDGLASDKNHVGAWNIVTEIATSQKTQTVLNNILNQGGQSIINHPFLNLLNNKDYPPSELAEYTGYGFLEIENPTTGVLNAQDLWDRMLAMGFIIGATGADDCHRVGAAGGGASTLTGTSFASTGTAVTCTGGTCALDTEISTGEYIGITEGDGPTEWKKVTAIASSTALTVESAFATPLSGSTLLVYDGPVFNKAFVIVNSDESSPTADGIMQAMKSGNFYSTTLNATGDDPTISMSMSGNVITASSNGTYDFKWVKANQTNPSGSNTALTGTTFDSSGTTFTCTGGTCTLDTEILVGEYIYSTTNDYRRVITLTDANNVEVESDFSTAISSATSAYVMPLAGDEITTELSVTTDTYTLDGTEGFVRLVLETAGGSNTAVAWSNPIFIRPLNESTVTPVSITNLNPGNIPGLVINDTGALSSPALLSDPAAFKVTDGSEAIMIDANGIHATGTFNLIPGSAASGIIIDRTTDVSNSYALTLLNTYTGNTQTNSGALALTMTYNGEGGNFSKLYGVTNKLVINGQTAALTITSESSAGRYRLERNSANDQDITFSNPMGILNVDSTFNGSGTVTGNLSGLLIEDILWTATNNTGIWINDQTNGTSGNYGLMVAGDDGVWQGGTGGTGIHSETVQLTAANINGLETTPITLASARSGAILQFVDAMLVWDYTADHTCTNADNKFRIRYNNGAGTIVSEAIDMNTFLEGSADAIRWMNPQATTDTDLLANVNQALVLDNEGTGDCVDGSGSTLDVKITYRVQVTGL